MDYPTKSGCIVGVQIINLASRHEQKLRWQKVPRDHRPIDIHVASLLSVSVYGTLLVGVSYVTTAKSIFNPLLSADSSPLSFRVSASSGTSRRHPFPAAAGGWRRYLNLLSSLSPPHFVCHPRAQNVLPPIVLCDFLR